MNTGCLILAGGKSRRMGYRKSSLQLNGTTFLDKLIFELRDFPEILVSVDDAARHPEIPYSMIDDRYPDCGPMSGLYSALSVCKSDALLVLPCDVPLFTGTLAHHLQEVMELSDSDALICITEDERIHPLCGIYRKSCTPVLERCLNDGNLKIMDALNDLKVHFYHVEEDSWQLQNINTPEEYQKLTAKSYLAISGFKNSGKTTLIERLIPELIDHHIVRTEDFLRQRIQSLGQCIFFLVKMFLDVGNAFVEINSACHIFELGRR